jgi:hypothetical protein
MARVAKTPVRDWARMACVVWQDEVKTRKITRFATECIADPRTIWSAHHRRYYQCLALRTLQRMTETRVTQRRGRCAAHLYASKVPHISSPALL